MLNAFNPALLTVLLMLVCIFYLFKSRRRNIVYRYNRGVATEAEKAWITSQLDEGTLVKNGYVMRRGEYLPQVRLSTKYIRNIIE